MGDRLTGAGLWPRLILSVVLLAGAVLGAVLTQHHESQVYGDASVVLSNCPETEVINCDTVNTSAWSELLGIPIAAFSIPTYLLVLFLLWRGRRDASLEAYAFSIGLMTMLYSAFLLYVSSRRIGVVCLYCMGLYGVNVAIPLFTALAARQRPLPLVRRTLSDLASWPRALRLTSGVFVILLAATIGAQQAYRVHVKREAADEQKRIEEQGGPLVPAGPASSLTSPGRPSTGLFSGEALAAEPDSGSAEAGTYKLAGPLRRIEAGPKMSDFDLQAKLGAGKPIALIFWSPGYRQSERLVVEMSRYLRARLPAFEVFAVTGRGDNDRNEEVLETATMLGLPADIPLLLDAGFAVSSALSTVDVPDVALFDVKGRLIVSKIKFLGQKLVLPTGSLTAEEVMQKVAAGTELPPIRQMAQYYPATELYGRCAPGFTARKFDSEDLLAFKGRPAGNKPLLLVFWSPTCKHCQVEIPLLVSWLQRNPERVEILSIARLKEDKPGRMSHHDITKNYIRDQKITWPVLEDPDGALAEVYRSISTPTTYFITSQGNITGAWFYPHPSNFDQAMEEALMKVKSMDAAPCRPVPDSPAPRIALDMLGPDGAKTSLASQLDKPTVLHLWATWCAPCLQEVPGILKFGETLEKSGAGHLVMLSVEDAAAGDRIAGFAKKLELPLRSFRAPSGGLASALDLSYRLPRTYLVSPDGVLVGSREGSQNWADAEFEERIVSRLRNSAALSR